MNLFVYGTLMRDGGNGALLGPFKHYAGTVRGRLYRMPEGVPALVLDSQGPEVHGAWVEAVDERTLALCDLYEGVDEGLYARVPCEVTIGLRRHAAQVYVMPAAIERGGQLISSGRWRNPIRRGRR